jgi:hypothetical protein
VFGDRALLGCRVQGRVFEAERDVLSHGEPREQPRLLEDDAAIEAGAGDQPSVMQHLAIVITVEPRSDAQQGRLAAAAGADDRDELAQCNGKIDAVEGLERPAIDLECLADLADLELTLGHSRPLPGERQLAHSFIAMCVVPGAEYATALQLRDQQGDEATEPAGVEEDSELKVFMASTHERSDPAVPHAQRIVPAFSSQARCAR